MFLTFPRFLRFLHRPVLPLNLPRVDGEVVPKSMRQISIESLDPRHRKQVRNPPVPLPPLPILPPISVSHGNRHRETTVVLYTFYLSRKLPRNKQNATLLILKKFLLLKNYYQNCRTLLIQKTTTSNQKDPFQPFRYNNHEKWLTLNPSESKKFAFRTTMSKFFTNFGNFCIMT